jgi:hypothetical protein
VLAVRIVLAVVAGALALRLWLSYSRVRRK